MDRIKRDLLHAQLATQHTTTTIETCIDLLGCQRGRSWSENCEILESECRRIAAQRGEVVR